MDQRLKNKISSLLSGWYGSDWGTTIRWHNDHILVKNLTMGYDIQYSLEQELEKMVVASTPTLDDLIFIDWNIELEIKDD